MCCPSGARALAPIPLAPPTFPPATYPSSVYGEVVPYAASALRPSSAPAPGGLRRSESRTHPPTACCPSLSTCLVYSFSRPLHCIFLWLPEPPAPLLSHLHLSPLCPAASPALHLPSVSGPPLHHLSLSPSTSIPRLPILYGCPEIRASLPHPQCGGGVVPCTFCAPPLPSLCLSCSPARGCPEIRASSVSHQLSCVFVTRPFRWGPLLYFSRTSLLHSRLASPSSHPLSPPRI